MKTQLHYLKTLQNSFSEIATKRVLERRLQKMKMVKKVVVQAIYKLPAEEENTIFRPGFVVRNSNIDYNKTAGVITASLDSFV